jgi:hypothetical protein
MTYRTSAKCHLSWCCELAGHDGDHLGPMVETSPGWFRQRHAPPNTTESDVLTCHAIIPPEHVRLGLQLENLRSKADATHREVEAALAELEDIRDMLADPFAWWRPMVTRLHSAIRRFATVLG